MPTGEWHRAQGDRVQQLDVGDDRSTRVHRTTTRRCCAARMRRRTTGIARRVVVRPTMRVPRGCWPRCNCSPGNPSCRLRYADECLSICDAARAGRLRSRLRPRGTGPGTEGARRRRSPQVRAGNWPSRCRSPTPRIRRSSTPIWRGRLLVDPERSSADGRYCSRRASGCQSSHGSSLHVLHPSSSSNCHGPGRGSADDRYRGVAHGTRRPRRPVRPDSRSRPRR